MKEYDALLKKLKVHLGQGLDKAQDLLEEERVKRYWISGRILSEYKALPGEERGVCQSTAFGQGFG